MEDSSIQAEGLIHPLRWFHSIVHELDDRPLPLILTSFAIHGVVHLLMKILLHMILGGRTHSSVHGDARLHPASISERLRERLIVRLRIENLL